MNKVINIVLKVIFSLILIVPILGVLGIAPAPTPDLYNTSQAYSFILILAEIKYINIIMAVVFALAIGAIWTKREALAVILVLPITLNIVAFHLFLDGGLLKAGAMMGNILFAINLYFLWQQRETLLPLLKRS